MHTAEQARCAGWRRGAAALCLALAVLPGCSPQRAPDAAPLLAEGQPFPRMMRDFVAGGLAGGRLPPGRTVVLNVWASWCGPCRREMPSLERLAATLDPRRFAVIGVSTDSDRLLAQEFLRQYGISFTNLLDQNGVAARRLGLRVYPDTFIIAPDGTLLRRMTGLHEWDSAAIIALLEGLHPAASATASLAAGRAGVYHGE